MSANDTPDPVIDEGNEVNPSTKKTRTRNNNTSKQQDMYQFIKLFSNLPELTKSNWMVWSDSFLKMGESAVDFAVKKHLSGKIKPSDKDFDPACNAALVSVILGKMRLEGEGHVMVLRNKIIGMEYCSNELWNLIEKEHLEDSEEKVKIVNYRLSDAKILHNDVKKFIE